ncbi:transglycosylase SLT domain-containing protein [Myxococcota bacterium]|nr:transglycosylase SLT domain-containing protein [Myxococcota bacterium]
MTRNRTPGPIAASLSAALVTLCVFGRAHAEATGAPVSVEAAPAAPVSVEAAPAAPAASAAPRAVTRPTLDGPIRERLPALAPAFDSLDAGKFGKAREVFDAWLSAHAAAPEAPAVRFLRARCDARLGNLAAADEGYAAAAAALPELAEYLRAERARLALRDGRFDAADDHLDALDPLHRDFVGMLLDRVQRELRAGRFTDALTTLGRLSPVLAFAPERARVARVFADARLALTGDRDAWRTQLAEVWRRWPKTDTGRELEVLLVTAAADVAIATTPLTLDELVDIGRRRADGAGVKAAEAVIGALERRFPQRVTGLRALYEAMGQIKRAPGVARQAITAVRPVVTESVIRDRLDDALARTLRQSERFDDALAVYERIGREGGSSHRRAEALLEGGRMARRMGRVASARWAFDRFLARHREFPEARAEALWNLGWFAWREGALDEADHFFRLIGVSTPDATDSSGRTYAERALYWRARILHRRGHDTEARALWGEIEKRYPLSYYANLSRAWRGRLGDDVPVLPLPGKNEPALPPTVASFTEVEPAAVPALTLIHLGLPDDARMYLRHLHRQERLGISGVQLLSALYRANGDESTAHWVVQGGDPLNAPPVAEARGRWLSAFPQPFGEIVRASAKQHAIDPLIIWSIMRQESGFRSQARSHAKAHGLMQVLLPTARHVAKRLLNERPPSLAKVYTPAANVHYGAAYLRHLLDRYKGNPALAFAGYNAGPGAVDKWLKRFGPIDCDEFVEEIPYAEAQGYARKVIRSYAAYTYLYGTGDDPFLTLPLKLPVRREGVASR